MPETPSMATSESWRGLLKEVKNEKAAPLSIRNETLCPASMPITWSSESVCMGWTWSLELGLRHWNNSGTFGSSLTSSEEPWSGVPGPPWVWFPDHCWAWDVELKIWWVVSEDNPFSRGPIVCRWGRVWRVAGGLGRTWPSVLFGYIWSRSLEGYIPYRWDWWAKGVEFFLG